MSIQRAPNEFCLSDLYIGQEIEFPHEDEGMPLTQEMQHCFTSLSGDTNPIHIDKAFALSNGFSGILCYGMLTASFYSTLVGVYLPGKYAIFQEADISFSKPVYIGDKLRIKGKITQIHESVKRIIIKAEIRNQHNERVSKAILAVGLTE